MSNNIAKELLEKYNSGNCTEEEKAIVESWFLNLKDEGSIPGQEKIDKVSNEIWASLPIQNYIRRLSLWPRIAAAASVLLILSAGGYFLLHTKQTTQQISVLKPGTFKNDVSPARNNAYITLGNGQRLTVGNKLNGNLAQQGTTNIQKNVSGQIIYQAATMGTTEVLYNTFVVPRGGGKRELRLADGTLAILDAGSSIHFPVSFHGKDRQVSITGQVYFEVVHNIKQPFFVTARGQKIEDIGTHFNINAFEDETTVKTTLLEGSIKINGNSLKPGQQAITNSNGSLTIEKAIDLEQVVAWKNDKFEFNKNTNLQAVMRQLARWYDLDISYQGANRQYHFAGDMPRDSKLSDVLKILEYNGLQFSIDGKKLIVYQ